MPFKTALSAATLVAALALAPAAGARDVYLLLGQSNMAGRGELGNDARRAAERISTERVEKLDKNDAWVEAVEPIHFDKPSAGGGLGASFGRVVADHFPSETVGLVPCAVGGSALNEWLPGAKLYVEAVRRARIAQRDGTIRAILWHQGESDADRGTLQETYNARLTKMVAALRADLGLDAEKVPFVYGAIGEFPHAPYYAGNKALNAVMREAVKTIPNAHWVEAADLRCNGDMIHFDLQSVRTLGERYARACLAAVRREPVLLRNVYSDHMLFQRGQPIVLAGTSKPGVTVTAVMDAAVATAAADAAGRWEVSLPARPAGGPFVITVKTADDQVRLRDVLVGELWLCSGSGDVARPVWGPSPDFRLADGEKLAAAAQDHELRLLRVPQGLDPDRPGDDTFGGAGWARADAPARVKAFSATAYRFGCELRKRLGVPVGIVDASWGGSRIESWISEPALRAAKLDLALADLAYARDYRPVVKGQTVVPRALKDKLIKLQQWVQKVDGQSPHTQYRGRDGSKAFWNDLHRPDGSFIAWDNKYGLKIPEPAFVWYRWTFRVPETVDDPELDLEGDAEPTADELEIPSQVENLFFEADSISDTDVAWFDGRKIGETDIGVRYYWGQKRRYAIPTPGPGRHVLVVRVNNHFGDGGFTHPRLVWKRGGIDLAKAKFLSLCWSQPNAQTGPRPPSPWGSDWQLMDPHGCSDVPTTIYNRMIAPLAPFRFGGVKWSSAGAGAGAADGVKSDACLRALAAGWRETFRRSDLAFEGDGVTAEAAGTSREKKE